MEIASPRPFSSSTIRIPLPPPPAAALTNRGKPIDEKSFKLSDDGRVGTFAFWAIFFASILSPIASITSGEGPTQFIFASITALANEAFSDKKP